MLALLAGALPLLCVVASEFEFQAQLLDLQGLFEEQVGVL